jgi:hypothetical protein
MLNAQLAHMGVRAALDPGTIGEPQHRPVYDEHPDHAVY